MDVEKLIERARATRVIGFTGGGAISSDGCSTSYGETVKQLVNPDGPALAEALSRQKAAGDAMKEALRPFANCLEYIKPDESDEEWAKFRLLIGDYRKADAALTAWNSIEQGDGG